MKKKMAIPNIFPGFVDFFVCSFVCLFFWISKILWDCPVSASVNISYSCKRNRIVPLSEHIYRMTQNLT